MTITIGSTTKLTVKPSHLQKLLKQAERMGLTITEIVTGDNK